MWVRRKKHTFLLNNPVKMLPKSPSKRSQRWAPLLLRLVSLVAEPLATSVNPNKAIIKMSFGLLNYATEAHYCRRNKWTRQGCKIGSLIVSTLAFFHPTLTLSSFVWCRISQERISAFDYGARRSKTLKKRWYLISNVLVLWLDCVEVL